MSHNQQRDTTEQHNRYSQKLYKEENLVIIEHWQWEAVCKNHFSTKR